jgi:hypothetical protein
MPPGRPTPADRALKQEAWWARLVVTMMVWCLGEGAGVLFGPFQPGILAGGGTALILVTLTWMLRTPVRWLMGRMILVQMMALDILDQSLQRSLLRRAIRRRGSLGSGPTSDGSSGSTSPGHDGGR